MEQHKTVGMQQKTIRQLLRKKINAWIDSIRDEELKRLAREDVIVTGGCIASMLMGEPINDIDVYFRNYATTLRFAQYYVQEFDAARAKRGGVGLPMFVQEMTDVRGRPRIRVVVKSAGVEAAESESESEASKQPQLGVQTASQDYQYFEGMPDETAAEYLSGVFKDVGKTEEKAEQLQKAEKVGKAYSPVFVSSNAISLAGDIQIILRFYGEPTDIHDTFDFLHCTNHWESRDDTLVIHAEALASMMSRTLVYRGSLYPVSSVIRTRKFMGRGWRINAGQMLKMLFQVSRLDLTQHEVLEDQLTGVDVAYFEQVLSRLREQDPEKIDGAYLCVILDELFG